MIRNKIVMLDDKQITVTDWAMAKMQWQWLNAMAKMGDGRMAMANGMAMANAMAKMGDGRMGVGA